MSKIGKISIAIPDKVKVVLSDNIINIEGPLGKKSMNIDLEMFDLNINDGKDISIKPKKIDKNSKRLWGMNRSLINTDFPSLIFKSKVSRSRFKDVFPNGPSILRLLPLIATLTFSGMCIFIFPIFDIKIPYKLFLHQFFVFLHLYLSLLLLA